jgi:hypothetical protein
MLADLKDQPFFLIGISYVAENKYNQAYYNKYYKGKLIFDFHRVRKQRCYLITLRKGICYSEMDFLNLEYFRFLNCLDRITLF